jgi:hypothetical protein
MKLTSVKMNSFVRYIQISVKRDQPIKSTKALEEVVPSGTKVNHQWNWLLWKWTLSCETSKFQLNLINQSNQRRH